MKHLKIYEDYDNIPDNVILDIEYLYLHAFDSDEDFNNYFMNLYDVDDPDDIDANYIPDDLIDYLKLRILFPNIEYDNLREIVSDVVSDIDLNSSDEIREHSHDDYILRKNAEKYNL